MIPVTSRIFMFEPSEYSRRPVIGYFEGERRSLLFDAGNSHRHAGDIRVELVKHRKPEPDFIVISHHHWDHWFGLKAYKAVSLCSEKTLEEIRRQTALDWSSDAVWDRAEKGLIPRETARMMENEFGMKRKDIDFKLPDMTFRKKITIDLGGLKCRVESFGGSHARDSVVLFEETEKVLFLGDVLYTDGYKQPQFDKTAEKLLGYGALLYIESHANKIYSNKQFLRRLESIRRRITS
ncbi:MBL fold metallo-hydrolase [Breznakiella homolactica]|uniref:MBL fold metallo-hydrolase n=1 Tax=Breznakiella homolactica TaxID=2798577 RepID=A0A7T8B9H9_9SPIR|nr:MBL fold metallo-hydrolase [Breznakiella homolactica]QQO09649.1 MBL fold metallo-hydrolase [Breznakiella homolactica]